MTDVNNNFVPRIPALAPAKVMGWWHFLLHQHSLMSQYRDQINEHGVCEMVLTDGTVWVVTGVDGVTWSLVNQAGERQVVSPLRIKHRELDKWDVK